MKKMINKIKEFFKDVDNRSTVLAFLIFVLIFVVVALIF
jgi:predicted nucleic acid-binding Zn ribbon protein